MVPLPTRKSSSALTSHFSNFIYVCRQPSKLLFTRRPFSTYTSRPASPVPQHVFEKLTKQQVRSIVLSSAIPMVGFGFMDNFVMITVGSAIDNSLGVHLGLATMTAAAMGQVVSDVSGVVFGDTLSRILRISPVQLTAMQQKSAIVGRLRLWGAVAGVILGCTMGATALYITPEREATAAITMEKSGSSTPLSPLSENRQEQMKDQLCRLQQVMNDVMTRDEKWRNRCASCKLYVDESMGACIPKSPRTSPDDLDGNSYITATVDYFSRENNNIDGKKDSAVIQAATEKRVVVFANTIYVPILADTNKNNTSTNSKSDVVLGVLKVDLENGSFYAGSEIQDAKRFARNLGFFMNHMVM
ncbi:unnamed protein product [Pseudo-nitzschia multistriata]|uniref:Uncharacterized protein n=1 Tax=Pseudo-nitzschia multistriata TaxID=183589 RepID=A0A448ZFX0_9STRA|nr:unnamed protein product [Pseudo-nitzschia multistriata]